MRQRVANVDENMTTSRRTDRKTPCRYFINEDEKDCILRLLTDNFLSTGGGYQKASRILEQKLGKSIKSTAYNNYMTTIMRTSFRYLEDFITKRCNKKIRPITFDEQRIIRTPLINCRKWMKAQHTETLFKIVKTCIKQSKEDISQQEALDLYGEVYFLINNHQKKFTILDQKKRGKEIISIKQNIGLKKKQQMQNGIKMIESQENEVDEDHIEAQ